MLGIVFVVVVVVKLVDVLLGCVGVGDLDIESDVEVVMMLCVEMDVVLVDVVIVLFDEDGLNWLSVVDEVVFIGGEKE